MKKLLNFLFPGYLYRREARRLGLILGWPEGFEQEDQG